MKTKRGADANSGKIVQAAECRAIGAAACTSKSAGFFGYVVKDQQQQEENSACSTK